MYLSTSIPPRIRILRILPVTEGCKYDLTESDGDIEIEIGDLIDKKRLNE